MAKMYNGMAGSWADGICKYGVTVMAVKNGESGYRCKSPACRYMICSDERTMIATDLCEDHYQDYLLFGKEEGVQ